jgi:hypothetical protein
MGWAAFSGHFSQTHLVTLFGVADEQREPAAAQQHRRGVRFVFRRPHDVEKGEPTTHIVEI